MSEKSPHDSQTAQDSQSPQDRQPALSVTQSSIYSFEFANHKSSSSIAECRFLGVVLGTANFWLPFEEDFGWLFEMDVALTL